VKLLLDENVPAPITSTVKTLLRRSHDVQHVIDMPGWSGTKDLQLYDKAKAAGFEVVVTNDAKQMNRKLEVEAIARSGLHRIQYPHKQDGLAGLGLAMATVCAALPSVLQELAAADGQRLVTLKGIDPGRDHRYGVRDPAIDPPKFWPQQEA
jgi:PIN like domain